MLLQGLIFSVFIDIQRNRGHEIAVLILRGQNLGYVVSVHFVVGLVNIFCGAVKKKCLGSLGPWSCQQDFIESVFADIHLPGGSAQPNFVCIKYLMAWQEMGTGSREWWSKYFILFASVLSSLSIVKTNTIKTLGPNIPLRLTSSGIWQGEVLSRRTWATVGCFEWHATIELVRGRPLCFPSNKISHRRRKIGWDCAPNSTGSGEVVDEDCSFSLHPRIWRCRNFWASCLEACCSDSILRFMFSWLTLLYVDDLIESLGQSGFGTADRTTLTPSWIRVPCWSIARKGVRFERMPDWMIARLNWSEDHGVVPTAITPRLIFFHLLTYISRSRQCTTNMLYRLSPFSYDWISWNRYGKLESPSDY